MTTPTTSFCLFTVLLIASTSAFGVTAKEYNALIKRAQAGDYEPALVMLRERGRQAPSDLRALSDHIIVASWAGKDDEVIAVHQTLTPSAKGLPAAAQAAVARAYRDKKQWDRALELYRDGSQRFPKDPAFSLGETMVLAESGHPDEAVTLGQSLVKSAPTEPDRRLALGYVYRIKHQPYAALHEAERAHALAPNKQYVTREYIFALQYAGLADAALRTANRYPNLMSASEIRRLEGDQAAELSRLAAMPSRREAERYAIADRALANYQRLLEKWRALGPEAKDDVLRARLDRIQALHSRTRMQDAVNEYEALRAEGVPIPHYILNDVASAYLYLRKPEIARDLYQEALTGEGSANEDSNERLSNQTGLFYALVETEDFNMADKLITQAQSEQAIWRRIKGVPQKIPNDLRLYVETTAATSRFYADDTVAAQKRLSDLVDRAPRDVGLRVELANVYLGRSLPRRAEQELKMAETLEPMSLEVIAGQGMTALNLQEWQQAQTLTNNAVIRYPENSATKNLARAWEVHNKAELRVSGYRGIASDSPVTGNGDFGVDTVLYSAPIDYNWRVFGGGGYAYGDFPEGRGNYRWLRTGAEWRDRDLTAEVEVSTHNYGYGTKPGARLMGAYDLDDHWQVGASAELRSRDTPLRALANDISSNSLGAYVRWRANERREWTLAVSPSHFSDGNNRTTATVLGLERLYTSPHFKADLQFNISASHNTKDDGPYYSPRSDLEVTPTVNFTHIIYRRYETVLEQKFILGAGVYAQKGYSPGAIGAVGYGLRYRFNDVVDVGATATVVSRPYDGQRERETRIMFDMNFRF